MTKKPVPLDYPEINKLYKHYKGGTYKVLTLATHSETDEPLVIYQSMLFGSIHARPLKMWFELIYEGITHEFDIFRFKKINDNESCNV